MGYRFMLVESPVGQLRIVADDQGLSAILWRANARRFSYLDEMVEVRSDPVLDSVENELRDYLLGTRREFTIRLNLVGGDFQKDVWQALLAIPYGALRTYSDIARDIGRPGAFRAVGAAIGMNPVSIIVPCHRVVGANGALTGFAGGLPAKAALLTQEGVRRQGVLSDIAPSPKDRWLAAS